METVEQIMARLPPAEELVKEAIRGLRRSKPSPKSKARTPDPLWSRVGKLFCHGSGFSWAICIKYGFDPDEQWDES